MQAQGAARQENQRHLLNLGVPVCVELLVRLNFTIVENNKQKPSEGNSPCLFS